MTSQSDLAAFIAHELSKLRHDRDPVRFNGLAPFNARCRRSTNSQTTDQSSLVIWTVAVGLAITGSPYRGTMSIAARGERPAVKW